MRRSGTTVNVMSCMMRMYYCFSDPRQSVASLDITVLESFDHNIRTDVHGTRRFMLHRYDYKNIPRQRRAHNIIYETVTTLPILPDYNVRAMRILC